MINKLRNSNPSSSGTATCKLSFFSFERGKISFLWPRLPDRSILLLLQFGTHAKGCPPLTYNLKSLFYCNSRSVKSRTC